MNEDQVEDVLIGDCCFKLPSEICVNQAVFNSVFSLETWENLKQEQKKRILQFLPKEVLSNPELTNQTIKDLFTGSLTRFDTTPLETLFNGLAEGRFDPEVVAHVKKFKKIWQKDADSIRISHYVKVRENIMKCRQKTIDNAISKVTNGYDTIPHKAIKLENGILPASKLSKEKSNKRKRYHEEILTINKESGNTDIDEDEFPVSKKPTLYTYKQVKPKGKVSEVKLENESDIVKNTTEKEKLNSSASNLNTEIQQLSSTTQSMVNSYAKPTSRSVNSKAREEQTAAKLAKLPKILPAPPSTPAAVTQPSSSQPTAATGTSRNTANSLDVSRALTIPSTSQHNSSPLLASQLLAPPAYRSVQQQHQLEFNSKSTGSMRSSLIKATGNSNFVERFDRPQEDEMESSSEDEFESAEPTGYSSNLLPKNTSAKITKGNRMVGKNKTKGNTKSPLGQISTPTGPRKPTPLTPVVPASSSSSSLPTVSTISSCNSMIEVSIKNVLNPPAKALGLVYTSPTTGLVGVKLPNSQVILGTVPTRANPSNLISTASTSSYVQTNTNVIQNLLTPKLIAQPLNARFLPTTTNISKVSESGTVSTATNVISFNLQSSSFNSSIKNNVLTSSNSSILLLNGPAGSNFKEASSASGGADGANSKVLLNQMQNRAGTSAASFATGFTSVSAFRPQVSSAISGATLNPTMSLADLNFSLSPDKRVLNSSNNNDSKRSNDININEEKIDDLSALDGISLDIPNLSDELELDGLECLDLDLCDFNSLVSEDKHYASFFSLIRDVLCSTRDHRMTYACLEATIRKWSVSPSARTNSWFSSIGDWNEALSTALHFLAGNYQDAHPEDFVPYIEYKYKTKYYQWIGAGRDSDNNLIPLCNMWLENYNRLPPIKKLEGENEEHDEEDEENEDSDSPEVEVKKKVKRPQTPPPPRCTTEWTVRASSREERDYFQQQEKQRFENPHKAFTYHMHEYESVVGPVKGVYSSQSGMTNKARGHSLLVDDRQPYVTILALVRDAVARLPNGEGTRSEICEMLRDSAFLAPEASSVTLNSVVSGALDRLHYERDPCVRYDSHKKNWIYLHRDRNQEQFERLHHNRSYTKSTKTRSSTSRKSRKHNKSTSSSGSQGAPNATPSPPAANSQSPSGSIFPSIGFVKLPPIETVMNKTSTNQSTYSVVPFQQKVNAEDTKLMISGERLSQFRSVSQTTADTTVASSAFQRQETVLSTSASTANTVSANNPILSSIIKGTSKTSSFTLPTNVVLASTSTPSLQINKSSSSSTPIILTPNSAVRFVNHLNVGNPTGFSSVRPTLQVSTTAPVTTQTAPTIVLRGNLPVQNRQSMLIMQGGQAAIILNTGSGVGQLGPVQLKGITTSSSTNSAIVQSGNSTGSSLSQASMLNFTPSTTGSLSSTLPAGIIHLGVTGKSGTPQNNTRAPVQLSVNAAVLSKLLAAAGTTPVTLAGSRTSTPAQSIAQFGQNVRAQFSVAGSTTSGCGTTNTGQVVQSNPVMLRSDNSFIRLVYGPGEVKLIPIAGQGNQPVIARLVPQTQTQNTNTVQAAQVTNSGQSSNTLSGQKQ